MDFRCLAAPRNVHTAKKGGSRNRRRLISLVGAIAIMTVAAGTLPAAEAGQVNRATARTLRGEPGFHLRAHAVQRKAALVTCGADILEQPWIDRMVDKITRSPRLKGRVILSRSSGPVTLTNNVIVGAKEIGIEGTEDRNLRYHSRSEAGLRDYPVLPETVLDYDRFKHRDRQ